MTICKKLYLLVSLAMTAIVGAVGAQEKWEETTAKLAIIELCNRYAHAMDHGDPDAWIATWAADGKSETPWDGVQNLKEMAVKARQDWSKPQPHRHILANHITSIEGDKATHRCYAYLVRIGDRKAEPRFIVEYEDQLQKIDGIWKFVFRRITVQE